MTATAMQQSVPIRAEFEDAALVVVEPRRVARTVTGRRPNYQFRTAEPGMAFTLRRCTGNHAVTL